MTTAKYMLLVFCVIVPPVMIGSFVGHLLRPAKSSGQACHFCAPERHSALTQVGAVPKQRWWESTDLSDVSMVLIYRENAKLLRDVLDTQIAAVALACAVPTYDSNGINERCLNAHMTLQTTVDTTMKDMVKHHYEVYEETLP